MGERLDKFLASQGFGTRKAVGRLIRSGAVAVDGVSQRDPSAKVDPEAAQVTVNGIPVRYSKYLYILMNKPAGVLSATEDRRQKTVLDLLPAELRRRGLFPAGRLDKDTTGLLLITDDGIWLTGCSRPKAMCTSCTRPFWTSRLTPRMSRPLSRESSGRRSVTLRPGFGQRGIPAPRLWRFERGVFTRSSGCFKPGGKTCSS